MRSVLFLLVAFVSLFGFSKKADYSVEYGWFKELGEARATLIAQGSEYKIKIEADTKGIAKFLSRDRREVYESFGTITATGYLPSRFVQFKSWSDKAERTTYTFNHAAKTVLKVKERYEDGKLVKKETKPNKYYADNDILTLYFNISDDFKTIKSGAQKIYYAVGANPDNGRVDLIVPDSKKLASMKATFEGVNASNFVVVFINQKIFASERGELWIAFNDRDECERATLKDVILFGDIRGILKR